MAKYQNVLMIVAVLSVGGFLYWLSVTATPTQSQVEEDPGAETEAAAFADATPVGMEEFSANPRDYIGRRIRFTEIGVASPLGGQAFWTTLTSGQPYLIRLDTAPVRQGIAVAGGDSVTVAGVVHSMTDSVLDRWVADSVLVNESQRVEAQFATTFLEADAARVTASQSGGEAEGETSDEGEESGEGG